MGFVLTRHAGTSSHSPGYLLSPSTASDTNKTLKYANFLSALGLGSTPRLGQLRYYNTPQGSESGSTITRHNAGKGLKHRKINSLPLFLLLFLFLLLPPTPHP